MGRGRGMIALERSSYHNQCRLWAPFPPLEFCFADEKTSLLNLSIAKWNMAQWAI